MNTIHNQQNGEYANTSLVKGNEALRKGNYAQAVTYYAQVLIKQPDLAKSISINFELARQKYRASRQSIAKPSVSVCGWELAHNAAGRVYTLATIYEAFADVEIIGSIFPIFGREIWEPLRDTEIKKHIFIVEDESKFIEQAIELVAAHPYDIVHLSKPRAPNIFFGILYKLLWNAKVLMDIDDEELAFVGADTSISIEDYVKQHGKLPALKNLNGKDWTCLSVGLAKEFDGLTVCNMALKQRYGGEIIRHARDEKLFNPSPEMKRESREKFGIPQEAKVVLFYGTPQEHKGLVETAQAISSLNISGVMYCIVGSFLDESLKKRILQIKGCEYKFFPNQSVNKSQEVLAIADCCVILQNDTLAANNQTPAKLTDALAMGVPVIAKSTPGIEDLIELGAAYKTTDTKLKKKIGELLGSSILAANQSTKGLKVYNEHLTKSVCANDLMQILDQTRNCNLVDNVWIRSKLVLTNIDEKNKIIHSLSSLILNETKKEYHGVTCDKEKNVSVDVVIPVFNALADVKKCLNSLEQFNDGFYVKLIVVNDGSGDETTIWLQEFCKEKPSINLIEHKKNMGYTQAVNTGLKASKADFIIILNSDTAVTENWLKGMLRCMNSSHKIGIVGPLSNAASWQNIPKLLDQNGEFLINEIPDGYDVNSFAGLVAKIAKRTYPRLPFVNGFCFLINRKVIDAIGYMDEENFPVGYGEENDYCIRTIDAGFELAIADDVFVYHAKSKSFGHDKRKIYSKKGIESLKRKHSQEKYMDRVRKVKETHELDLIRENVQKHINKNLDFTSRQHELTNMRILFLLPVTGGGGGAHSVVQEATEMCRLGIHARVAMRHEQINGFLNNYADIPEAKELFISFDDRSIIQISENYDIVIGTVFSSMKIVKRIVDINPHILPAYYIQDYEPMFFQKGSEKWLEAYDSYNLVPNAIMFAKTQWIIDEVELNHGVKVHKVNPSIDHDVYKPKQKIHNGKMRLVAMIRPQTPYRGAARTMRILEKTNEKFKNEIEIHLFGCLSDSQEFLEIVHNFPFVNHGILRRYQVANLLSSCDLFIDLSDYQAFGRTALEAMACGCAAVVPIKGGTSEYAEHKKNALMVDTTNETECFDAICEVLSSKTELMRLQRAGFKTASRYSVHAAAVSECLILEHELIKHRKKYQQKKKPTLVLIPSHRNDGLLTGSGFVRVGLPYLNDEILKAWNVKQSPPLPPIGTADVALIQREVIGYTAENLEKWLSEWRFNGGKIVYEIDDDLLDENGLKQRGHKDNPTITASKVQMLLEVADQVHVSTKTLKNKFKKFNNNIHVIPNVLDPLIWKLDEQPKRTNKHSGDKIKIGYIGTETHYNDLILIENAMNLIKSKYGNKIEVEVIGVFQNLKPLFGTRVALPKRTDYPSFVEWLLKRVDWDIGIIPLIEDSFNSYKSNLKFLEYSALGLPIIVSDVYTYRSIARNGVNCISVNNSTTDWVNGLSMLIENEKIRLDLAENARTDCFMNHTTKKITEHIIDLMDAVITKEGLKNSPNSANPSQVELSD